jgi:BCD family chlorophyll transporter-like MFS transporter
MTGLGMHMTQTAGLALAADRATDETRPRVVALLYVMFLVGMGVSAVVIGWLLRQFTPLELIQVIQGCAVLTVVLNVTALWKQERVRPMTKAEREEESPSFADAWADYSSGGTAGRLLVVVFLGTMAFNMQDVLLEPYGGEILGLSVSSTTLLTATWAAGRAGRVRACGALAGRGDQPLPHGRARHPRRARRVFGGDLLQPLGLGGAVLRRRRPDRVRRWPVLRRDADGGDDDASGRQGGRGLALGAWGAAQATAAGLSIAIGGGIRDLVNGLAANGRLGEALANPATGYSVVYHLEILLLFITLVALGPLVRTATTNSNRATGKIGLADLPT